MAYLITPQGETRLVTPANGKAFKLQELQAFVGGYIEIVRTAAPGITVVCNEEGKLLGMKPNPIGTSMLQEHFAKLRASSPHPDPIIEAVIEWGSHDFMVGPIVVCTDKEIS